MEKDFVKYIIKWTTIHLLDMLLMAPPTTFVFGMGRIYLPIYAIANDNLLIKILSLMFVEHKIDKS